MEGFRWSKDHSNVCLSRHSLMLSPASLEAEGWHRIHSSHEQ